MSTDTDFIDGTADMSHLTDFREDDDDGEVKSYSEILADVILNDEIVITIPAELEEKTKNGIKNCKSKAATLAKKEGQPVDSSTLSFISIPSTEFAGCIDMTITCVRQGTVRIKKMRIPVNDFPE